MRRAAAGALAGGALALALLLAAGLLVALLAPDASFLGQSGAGAPFLEGWLRATLALTGARFDGRTLAPLALVAIPIAAAGAGGRLAARIGGARTAPALALPFAAGLIVLALAARGAYTDPFAAAFDLPARAHADAELLSVVVLALAWGALGGALGARRLPFPAWARAVLMPLALTLALLGSVGALYWDVSTLRGDTLARVAPRSEPTAVVENTLLAGEHAVDLVGLGAQASFSSLPLPISRAGVAALSLRGSRERLSVRLSDYHRLLPGWAYGLLLVVTIAIPLAGAALSGARLVAALAPRGDAAAAAAGALTGPVWALAVLALAELSFYRGAIRPGELALRVLVAAAAVGAAAGAFTYRDLRRAGRGTA